jgi:CheY-like chemotaxis protein
MPIPVLVVDAAEQFGTLIHQTLEETGYYQVTLAKSGTEAVEIVQSSEIRLAIVDFDLPDIKGPDAIRQLREASADLAVIAIPLSSDPDDPDLKELGVDGLLTKPFYLPDLPKIVAAALDLPPDAPVTLGPSPTAPSAEHIPTWLEDHDQAGQYLTQLFLGIQALAAILTRGQRPWAYAGEMDQSHVEDITNLVAEHWTGKGVRGAVARFINLPGIDRDFMFYTTHVVGDIILSLIFVPETPFSAVRSQGETMAKTLSEVDPSEDDSSVEESANPKDDPSPNKPVGNPRRSKSQTPGKSPDAGGLDPVSEEGMASEQISEGSPPDDPTTTSAADRVSPSDDKTPDQASSATQQLIADVVDPELISHAWEEDLSTDSQAKKPDVEESMVVNAVLLPRSPKHKLSDTLAEHLNNWLLELGAVLGWEFSDVDIQPEYLCFTLKLPSKTHPAGALEQLRQELSDRVLKSFPDLLLDVPEERFWAHNYLLTTGGAPSKARIHIFLQNTRRSQGLTS